MNSSNSNTGFGFAFFHWRIHTRPSCGWLDWSCEVCFENDQDRFNYLQRG